MKETDRIIADELKNRLSEFVHLLDFCVFGSRARLDGSAESDMDVFIEVETLGKHLKERILATAWEVGFNNFLVISPLIFTRDELVNSPLRSSPVVKAIQDEGLRI